MESSINFNTELLDKNFKVQNKENTIIRIKKNLKYPLLDRSFSDISASLKILFYTCGPYLVIYDYRNVELVIKLKLHAGVIRHVSYSQLSNSWLSVGDDKKVILFKLDVKNKNLNIISSRDHSKKLVFVQWIDGNKFLIGDKFGDIYVLSVKKFFGIDFDCGLQIINSSFDDLDIESLYSNFNYQKKGENMPQISHFSQITSMCYGPKNLSKKQFLMTCDRDGKILVSRIPRIFHTERYLLGHKLFVTSIVQPQNFDSILFSCGGDCTIRAWNYLTGDELDLLDLQMEMSESLKNPDEYMCYLPTKLYWIEELNELLIIVANFEGFCRLPFSLIDRGNTKNYSFGKVTCVSLPAQGSPKCLIRADLNENILKSPSEASCLIDTTNTCLDSTFDELNKRPDEIILFWVDALGNLRKPITLTKGNPQGGIPDTNTVYYDDILLILEPKEGGDFIDCMNFWKHNHEEMELMRETGTVISKRRQRAIIK